MLLGKLNSTLSILQNSHQTQYIVHCGLHNVSPAGSLGSVVLPYSRWVLREPPTVLSLL